MVKGKEELVSKMKTSLWVKKSLRMWDQKFDTFILGLGFTGRKSNHFVY